MANNKINNRKNRGDLLQRVGTYSEEQVAVVLKVISGRVRGEFYAAYRFPKDSDEDSMYTRYNSLSNEKTNRMMTRIRNRMNQTISSLSEQLSDIVGEELSRECFPEDKWWIEDSD